MTMENEFSDEGVFAKYKVANDAIASQKQSTDEGVFTNYGAANDAIARSSSKAAMLEEDYVSTVVVKTQSS